MLWANPKIISLKVQLLLTGYNKRNGFYLIFAKAEQDAA